jgi:hypothetical protein
MFHSGGASAPVEGREALDPIRSVWMHCWGWPPTFCPHLGFASSPLRPDKWVPGQGLRVPGTPADGLRLEQAAL